ISVCFFQSENCIRDRNVTGVHTCALPISPGTSIISSFPSLTLFTAFSSRLTFSVFFTRNHPLCYNCFGLAGVIPGFFYFLKLFLDRKSVVLVMCVDLCNYCRWVL